MIRIVDVPGALEGAIRRGSRWRSSRITDDLLPRTTGQFVLRWREARGG
jgi:hypothetical protein